MLTIKQIIKVSRLMEQTDEYARREAKEFLRQREIDEENIREFPYEVVFPDGEDDSTPPKFETWKDALAKQVEWNRDCPGHIARRRR